MRFFHALFATALLLAHAVPAIAQAEGAPVHLDGHALLTVGESPALSARERASILEHRLNALVAEGRPVSFELVEQNGQASLIAGDRPLLTVTAQDLELNLAESPSALAGRWRGQLEPALERARQERSWDFVARSLALTVLATVIAWALHTFLTMVFLRLRDGLSRDDGDLVDKALGTFRRIPLLSGLDVRPALQTVNLWVLWLTRLGLFNLYVLVVLGLYPQTRPFNDVLLNSILASVTALAKNMLAYLPNLVTIAVTLVATRYAIKLIRFMFARMKASPDDLGFGLPVELIDAIGKLGIGIAWVFAAMVIAPLLPGLGTQTGQLVGLLVGAMITLGSGSTIGNAVAGFVLTYMRPFEVGDRVRIGEHEGDIIERNFTNVRLRTIKNAVVTLTSQQVLATAITNFSTDVSREEGLILNTTVTVGYDVPRAQAEALLLAAARRTDGIAATPAPFVLVTGLGDFAIRYELNATTFYPHAKALVYSELHKHLIDVFAEAGVEMVSPVYNAMRDGNAPAVPAEAPETAPHQAISVAESVVKRYAGHPHYRSLTVPVVSHLDKEDPTA